MIKFTVGSILGCIAQFVPYFIGWSDSDSSIFGCAVFIAGWHFICNRDSEFK